MRPLFRAYLWAVLSISFCTGSIFKAATKGKCQNIDIPFCSILPYNLTYSISTLPHDQTSIVTSVEHFKPLVKTQCNPNVHFFICSVFAPMCPPSMPQAVTSCRSVCEQVYKDCNGLLKEFDLQWPEPLNCSKFPDEPDLCMKPKLPEDARHRSRPQVSAPYSCPSDLIDVDPSDAHGICASNCGADVLFTSEDKQTARGWMKLLGSMNGLVSLFIFLTFLIDRHRFHYPEKCVFYLSLCMIFFSIPYLFPFILSYTAMACDKLINGEDFLIYSGWENTNCLISFSLTYYFGTAANFWWLMFAFTWYLSAGRKWVPEGIEACGNYVHLVAWGASAILTIAVLITHKVDASELTGICSVGNQDPRTLIAFSLLPKTAIILIGACFILAGFSSMCSEKAAFRGRGTDTSKLEKLMVKMGLFCIFYILPNVISIVCESYHYLILTQYFPNVWGCKQTGGVEGGLCKRPRQPETKLYLLGVIMPLAAGIACFMWILSPKTFNSWQRFLCCGLCSSAPSKPLGSAARPLLEPPSAPLPQPPAGTQSANQPHYVPMSTHSHNVWRPSKVV